MRTISVIYIERFNEFEHQLHIFTDDSIEIYFMGRLVSAYQSGGPVIE